MQVVSNNKIDWNQLYSRFIVLFFKTKSKGYPKNLIDPMTIWVIFPSDEFRMVIQSIGIDCTVYVFSKSSIGYTGSTIVLIHGIIFPVPLLLYIIRHLFKFFFLWMMIYIDHATYILIWIWHLHLTSIPHTQPIRRPPNSKFIFKNPVPSGRYTRSVSYC